LIEQSEQLILLFCIHAFDSGIFKRQSTMLSDIRHR
jgi:hypothetical protein